MTTLAELARSEDISVLEEVPGMVWRLVQNEPANAQHAPRRGLFGFLKREKEEKLANHKNTKEFACWTCGKKYVAPEFLWHIRDCCKGSSSKTTGNLDGK